MAQTKGRFEVHDLDNFKLHVYYTNDALGDASYIVEGKDALVTMEQPLFKDNVVEFDAYLSRLEKPVEKRITDYHVGGTGSHDVVMAEGMPEFTDLGWGGFRVPSRRNNGFSGCKHFDRRQGLLYALDSGKGTCQPLASVVTGCHRRGNSGGGELIGFGCDAVCRRTRRRCYTRCGGVQNCLSEEDERVACGKQNGTNFRGCDERGLSRSIGCKC